MILDRHDNGLSRRRTLRIVLAFACVYLCWGSAFVAIRYSVQTIHPAFVAGIRYLIAGGILLSVLAVRGSSLKIGRRDLTRVTGLGLLMFTCNTLLLSYAGRQLPAGLTALIIATIPLFMAVLEALLTRNTSPTLSSRIGIVLGFSGIALLLRQSVREGLPVQSATPAAIGLIVAAFAWALGSVLLSRTQFQAPALVCTAWQMMIGGAIDVLVGLGTGGFQSSHASKGPWLAVMFLAIFGTLAGYTAYTYLLRNVSISSVATYAYINPLVAVVLGWLLLNEPLSFSQGVAVVIVLASVALVVSAPKTPAQGSTPIAGQVLGK
ncbi:MAG: EamA family transporter [Edaphobacter sp.]|uniref:EamA family transporter n=1 Tax=Edaphobacter sp. TaxID=1934404 RepID=UPI002392FD93|nr:EamA family transporter [Edaphobacter sp.]MDE1178050.1 EamA family transporter [Edaphobacter sp.]